jgi:formate hydrogenlyase subunit 6/NADH:ubiquinone oxidoreductase subunit I
MRKAGSILPYALKSLFKKPATTTYPYTKANPPAGFRGKLAYDASKCIGCKLCVKDCPAGAIEIIKIGEKQYKAVLQLDRCIYCGQCADSCNKDALRTTHEFELAAFDRKNLKVDL